MIVYINVDKNQCLFDTTMLSKLLRISPSKVKRECLLFGFNADDYVMYKNRFLFKEDAVIRFMDFLVEKKILNEMASYKRKMK